MTTTDRSASNGAVQRLQFSINYAPVSKLRFSAH
jgi:hypothetical protein